MMKLRLHHRSRSKGPLGPWFHKSETIPELGIVDPGPAFRIIDPPDEGESVRRIPRIPGRPPPSPLEAGYRWGMPAARTPCDLSVEAGRTESPGTVEIVPAYSADHLPVPRFERAVLAVAARTEVLASAVERMHDRLEELDDRFVDVVTHGDLVETESRRARLAAEVSRLSVELKAELDRRVSELGRVMAEAKQRAATVDHLGPLDLAEAKRVEIHVDHLTEVTDLETRRTA